VRYQKSYSSAKQKLNTFILCLTPVISGEIVGRSVKGSEHRPALLLIFLVLSLMWLYADQNLVAPLLTTMAADRMIPGIKLHCNVTDPSRIIDACATSEFFYYAGLVGMIPTLSGILTTFVWGYLADKLSRRILFALAVLVGEIPCFLTGFARNYYELLVLRTLTGIGINGAAPVARALVADIYPPEERGKGYAVYNFSSGFGVLLGMVMAGIVVSMGMSWRVPFMLAAAPNFLLVPLFLLTVKEIKMGFAEPELRKLYESGLEYRYRINLREFKEALLTTPTLIFIYLQGVPGTFPWVGYPTGHLHTSRSSGVWTQQQQQ
jgi:MFS family permease